MLEPLIAGVRRVVDGRAAGVVIGEHGRQLVGRRIAEAVEMREAAVALPEETEHRHHPVDRRQEDA